MDIEKIYNDYFRIIYRYILSLSKDPELSEDIAQETFVKALKNAGELDESDNVTAWLCRIARNDYYKHCRKSKRHLEIIRENYEEIREPGAEAELMKSEDRVSLYKQLHLLEEPYKEVFSLRSFGELSFREIGAVFDRTENWARVTYHRARKKLMEVMKNERQL